MLREVLQWLAPSPGSVLVDGTLGGGGHARALAEQVGPRGLVIGIDRDPHAIQAAQQRFSGLPILPIHGNFCDLPEILAQLQIAAVDGVLLDLGVSSDQLADPHRGFSFACDGPLDMRFDPLCGEPARRLVNKLSPERLADLIYRYGQERYSRQIARAIAQQRRRKPIETALELAEVVRSAVPSVRGRQRIDPATKTFQALRIAVNDELKSLQIALKRIPECMRSQARLVIISFHSLEDREVKQAFRTDHRLKLLTPRPITPSPEEIELNPRARSAKLRAAARA